MPVDARRPRRLVLRPPARALDEVVAPEEGLVVRVVVEGADLFLGGREGDRLDVVCFYALSVLTMTYIEEHVY